MSEGGSRKGDNNAKEVTLQEMIAQRKAVSDAIVDFLRGRSVQECLDTLDVVKRKILSRAVF